MFESMGSAHMYDLHVKFQSAYLILPVIPQSSECFSNLTYCIWEKLIIMINIHAFFIWGYWGVYIYKYLVYHWLLHFINTILFFNNLRHIKLRFVLFTFSVQGGDGILLMISSSHWSHHSLSMPFTSKFGNASVSQVCSVVLHHRDLHEYWIEPFRTNK